MMAWGRRPVKRGLVDLRHLSRQSRLAAGKMSKVNEINVTIKDNKVVVYSKTYCPFCTMAKDALGDAGLKDYLVIELDKIESGDAYQDALKEITGGRTVPRVFIGGRFVGGGDAVKGLQDTGKLKPMLQEAGAL